MTRTRTKGASRAVDGKRTVKAEREKEREREGGGERVNRKRERERNATKCNHDEILIYGSEECIKPEVQSASHSAASCCIRSSRSSK